MQKKVFKGLGISGAIVSAIISIIISGIFEEATKTPDIVITKLENARPTGFITLINSTEKYNLEIYNQGNKAATDCRVSTGYNDLMHLMFEKSFSLRPGDLKELEYYVKFTDEGTQTLKFKIVCDNDITSKERDVSVEVLRLDT